MNDRDIRELVDLLSKSQVCLNTHVLYNYKSDCNLNGLTFYLEKEDDDFKLRNIHPDVSRIEIKLFLTFTEEDIFNTNYPKNGYNFKIEYKGFDNNGKEYISGFHLDREFHNDSDFIHPYFHLHFGGSIWDNISEYGEVLSLRVPRIAYHPMDIILGIDFILSNFYSKDKYQSFANNTKYKELLKQSQQDYVIRYYQEICKSWQNKQPSSLYPTLVIV